MQKFQANYINYLSHFDSLSFTKYIKKNFQFNKILWKLNKYTFSFEELQNQRKS